MQLSLEVPFKDIFEDERDEKFLVRNGGFEWWSMIEWLMIGINPFYTEKGDMYIFFDWPVYNWLIELVNKL